MVSVAVITLPMFSKFSKNADLLRYKTQPELILSYVWKEKQRKKQTYFEIAFYW